MHICSSNLYGNLIFRAILLISLYCYLFLELHFLWFCVELYLLLLSEKHLDLSLSLECPFHEFLLGTVGCFSQILVHFQKTEPIYIFQCSFFSPSYSCLIMKEKNWIFCPFSITWHYSLESIFCYAGILSLFIPLYSYLYWSLMHGFVGQTAIDSSLDGADLFDDMYLCTCFWIEELVSPIRLQCTPQVNLLALSLAVELWIS